MEGDANPSEKSDQEGEMLGGSVLLLKTNPDPMMDEATGWQYDSPGDITCQPRFLFLKSYRRAV